MDINVSNIVIILILCVALFFAFKSSLAHFKGQGACCGGGGSDVKTKPKKLAEVKSIKVAKIEGMHCEHCYTRVSNVLNSIDGISAVVHGKRGEAVIKIGKEIDDEVIISAIEKLDYKVVSLAEKNERVGRRLY